LVPAKGAWNVLKKGADRGEKRIKGDEGNDKPRGKDNEINKKRK